MISEREELLREAFVCQEPAFAAVPAIRATFRAELEALSTDELRGWVAFHRKRSLGGPREHS